MPELVWEGKYDDDGRRVAPPRVSLPFQTVETVNESAQERQRSLDFFAGERPADWRNRLDLGRQEVRPARRCSMSSAGKSTSSTSTRRSPRAQDFSFSAAVPESTRRFDKQPSVIEQKAYRDTWGKGLDSYVAVVRRHRQLPR